MCPKRGSARSEAHPKSRKLDGHLLEPTQLTSGACLWTRDERFLRVAERLDRADKTTCSIKENS
jgi:hypothetical protein